MTRSFQIDPAYGGSEVKWKSISCVWLCNTMDFTVHGILQARTLGSLSLLQGIFPTQGSNRGLPHCRQILHQLSHKGSPDIGVRGRLNYEINLKHVTNTETLKDTVYTNWNKSSGIPYSSGIASRAYMSFTPSDKTNTCYLFILNYKIWVVPGKGKNHPDLLTD